MDDYPRIVPYSSYGRVYEVSKGIFFPSVTTVLRFGLPLEEFLFKWFLEQSQGDYQRHIQHNGAASEIGTFVHDAWDKILDGGEIVIPENPLEIVPGRNYYPSSQVTLEIRKALLSLISFWEKQSPKVIDKEMLLYSLKMKANEFIYPFMGRCDLVCKIGKDTWMLDIKTSRNVKGVLKNQAQLTMYSMLWNDMYPDNPVDRMGIIWAKKDWKGDSPPKSVCEPFEYEFDANLVRDIYAIFKRIYDGFELGKPKVKKPLPTTFSLADCTPVTADYVPTFFPSKSAVVNSRTPHQRGLISEEVNRGKKNNKIKQTKNTKTIDKDGYTKVGGLK